MADHEVQEFFRRRNVTVGDVEYIMALHLSQYPRSPLSLKKATPTKAPASPPEDKKKEADDGLADKAGKGYKDPPEAHVVDSKASPKGYAKADSGRGSTGGKAGGYSGGDSGSGK